MAVVAARANPADLAETAEIASFASPHLRIHPNLAGSELLNVDMYIMSGASGNGVEVEH